MPQWWSSEPARVLVIWTAFLSPAPVRTATVACSWRAAAGSGEENPGSSNTASAQSMYRRTSRLCFSGECWNKPLVEILVHTSVPSDDSEILSSVVFFISDVLEAEGWWYPSVSSNQNYSIICLVPLRTVSFSLKFGTVVTSKAKATLLTCVELHLPALGETGLPGFYGPCADINLGRRRLAFQEKRLPLLTANLLTRPKHQHPI